MAKEPKIPHTSEFFWKRLAQVFAASAHSHQSLADAIGVNRKTVQRLLSRETYDDAIRLIFDVAFACGQHPKNLFDPDVVLAADRLTGISSIDDMLRESYNDKSMTGLEGFSKCIAKKYRVINDGYGTVEDKTIREKFTPVTKAHTLQSDFWSDSDEDANDADEQPARLGLTFRAEYDLNKEAAEKSSTTKQVVLKSGSILQEMVIVEYVIYEHQADHPGLSQRRTLMDHLLLDRPISRFRDNARLKPKILRRHWRQLTESYAGAGFFTDWSGYEGH